MSASAIENELDLSLCLQRLWRGKGWIIGGALLGILLAWVYTLVAPQKWIAVAQLQHPEVSSINGYLQNSKQLAQVITSDESITSANTGGPSDLSALIEPLYQKFIQRLASVDNRRAFWQQIASAQKDTGLTAAKLEKKVADIQFIPGDPLHGTVDTLRLQASNAPMSSRLLASYVEYTNQSLLKQVTQNINIEWQAAINQLHQQIVFQQRVAQAAYQQQLRKLKQSGAQRDLTLLQQQGPEITPQQLENQAQLEVLQAGPVAMTPFRSWSYLQTPYPPVKRTSPRLLLLCVMWGLVGLIIGAGTALARR